MKKVRWILGAIAVLLLFFAAAHVLYYTRDRNPDYTFDLDLPTDSLPAETVIQVGLAKTTITPTIHDTWVDTDSNAQYEPEKGDTFIDGNGNTVSFISFAPITYNGAWKSVFWYRNESIDDPTDYSWVFTMDIGYQDDALKGGSLTSTWTHLAWAVREGDVAPVPEPTTIYLLGSGLLGLSGLKRKLHKV